MKARPYTYALGLGSNRWSRYGPPARALDAAVAVLAAEDVDVLARSPMYATPAMGGAGRRFANEALLIETELSPPELMRTLQAIERAFGRRPGRRWGTRVLDLDILLMASPCEDSYPCEGRGPGHKAAARANIGQDAPDAQSPSRHDRRALDPCLRRGTLQCRGIPQVPHPGLAQRSFVLQPLARIAPGWRMPGTSLTVRHLAARLARPRPVDRDAPAA